MKTQFTCSDGEKGRGTFTYFDKKTGTATGKGRTNSGDRLRFWAGGNLADFVTQGSEDDTGLIGCVQRALVAAR